MKRVFLFAYDHINVGDDLFIYKITQRYPNVQFYLWSSSENKITFRSLKNLKIISKDSGTVPFLHKLRPSLVARYKDWWCKRCDAVVYIGGSIFIEYPEWRDILNWWDYAADNYSLYILGANFGPYASEEYKCRMGDVLKKAKDVCFRDKYSWKLFCDAPQIRYAPDILFSASLPTGVDSGTKQIFFSVINCVRKKEGIYSLDRFEETYIGGVSNLMIRFVKDGYKVLLGSFCEEEGDEEAAYKILDNLPDVYKSQCDVISYNGKNMQEILQTICRSSYIVATRFHAVILGIAANRPVFPLVYSNKTIHILQDIGYNGAYFDIRTEHEYNYEIAVENLRNHYVINASNAISQSEEHFKKLDNLLL